ncbi:MAG: Lrp/AsnC ligand binding domain-containing protein [Candidatus Thermoplasmatota archaeon]|nr:Lrp/AsnC ligand binding domain-containing protein [Candidatus Thermoplasmatota archaeon]
MITLVVAFILIKEKPGFEVALQDGLKDLDGVIEIYTLFGEYDIIIKVETKDYKELEQLIVKKIRNMPGIIDTKTLTGITL